MTYGYCVYHEIECDYKGSCIDCPHNTEEDAELFRQDKERIEQTEDFRRMGLLPTESEEISREEIAALLASGSEDNGKERSNLSIP